MIRMIKAGHYKLIETKHHTKILYLDNVAYAWLEPVHVGEILVFSHRFHKTDSVLSTGEYRIYDVKDEPSLFDQQHLELEAGNHYWQGYLLPTGLPNIGKKKSRIIPTHDVITNNLQIIIAQSQRRELTGVV